MGEHKYVKITRTEAKRAKTLQERVSFVPRKFLPACMPRAPLRRNKSSGKKKWTDPDDAPELTHEFFRSADVYEGARLLRRGRPPAGERPKEAVKLRISPDVLDHFRAGGPGWQTRINATLERAVSREKKARR